ncbi:hypothetical protein [Fodinicurvata sp. EGI_FJ10296]|uniref:hypothetical protein n=1 Tax=Fodinicurvata sp. EGI_FJ10296 TaxID=3231908 RepID=UPI003454BF51
MPREIRYILFEQAEIARAIADWRRMDGKPLALASIFSVTVSVREGSDSLEAIYRVGDHAKAQGSISEHRISEYDLTVAILAWCRQNGVPLPRRSAKRLEPLGDSIALLVTNFQTDRDPDVRQERVLYDDPKLDAVRRRLGTGKRGIDRDPSIGR